MSFYVHNNNRALEIAINNRNCGEAKVLLSSGADINHTVNEQLDTMLHTAKCATIVCDLLQYNAKIDSRNLYEKTPLHSAVADEKSVEFIRMLLQHQADINAKDSTGNTPLNLAVKMKTKNLELIKELVLQGADVNARNYACEGIDAHHTPLDNAILLGDLSCAKVLIKYALMRPFRVRNAIDLHSHYKHSNYHVYRKYRNDCMNEIDKMTYDIIGDTTLYEVVVMSNPFRETLCKGKEGMKKLIEKTLAILGCNIYSIYGDVVTNKLVNKLDQTMMLNKLRNIQVYFQDISIKPCRKIFLDSDSAHLVAKQLSREDLLNFILVFYDYKKHGCGALDSINNLLEITKSLNKRLCEPCTSSCAKYLKYA